MSTSVLRAQLEGLSRAGERLEALRGSGVMETLTELRALEHRLNSHWSGAASDAYHAAHGSWLAGFDARSADLGRIARWLISVATDYGENDAALVRTLDAQDPVRHLNAAHHGSSGLARVGDSPDAPPWEQAGFGWWAAAFVAEHGRPPTEGDYDEFLLSWQLSGQGAIAWTPADWEALYVARQEGLGDWLALGRIHGPMSGVAVLAEVRALNRVRDVHALIDQHDYQAAIDRTVAAYHLDAVAGVPIVYDPMHVGVGAYARFDPVTHTVILGSEAFSAQTTSPNEFASMIGHELVHARQYVEGRIYLNPNSPGNLMNEYEAWHWELEHAAENRLSTAELNEVRARLTDYYNALPPEDRALADQGIYTIPGAPTFATPVP